MYFINIFSDNSAINSAAVPDAGEMIKREVESNDVTHESEPHNLATTTLTILTTPLKFCCHSTCTSLSNENNTCPADDNLHFIRFPQPCLDYRLAKPASKFRKSHKVVECYNCDLATRWVRNCGETYLDTIDDISSDTFICSKHFKSVEDAQLYKEDPSPETSELQQPLEPTYPTLSTSYCDQIVLDNVHQDPELSQLCPTNQQIRPTLNVSTMANDNNMRTNSGMNKKGRSSYGVDIYKSPVTGKTDICAIERTIMKKIQDLTNLTLGANPNIPITLSAIAPLQTSALSSVTRVCCFDQCTSRSDQLSDTSAEKSFCFIKFPLPCHYYRRIRTKYRSLRNCHHCVQCDLAARWVSKCGRKRGLVGIDNITRNTYICSKHFSSVENARLYIEDPEYATEKERLPLIKLENDEISISTCTETSPSMSVVTSPSTSFEISPSTCIEEFPKTCERSSTKTSIKTPPDTFVESDSKVCAEVPQEIYVSSPTSKVNSHPPACNINVGVTDTIVRTSSRKRKSLLSKSSVVGELYDRWAELNKHPLFKTLKNGPKKKRRAKCLDRSNPMMIDEADFEGELPAGDQPIPIDFYLDKVCCYGTCTNRRFINNRLAENDYCFIRFPQPCVDYRMAARGSEFYQFHRMFGCDKCKLADRWVQMCGRQSFTIDDITFNTYICSKHFDSVKNAELYIEDPIPATGRKRAKRGRPKKGCNGGERH